MTVHHDPDPNAGASGATLRLAEAYKRKGHTVNVFSYGDLPSYLVRNQRLRFFLFPIAVAYYVERHRRHNRVDVVDASTGDAWLWELMTRRDRYRPLLVTRSHGLEHTAHEMRLEEAQAGRLTLSWKYKLYLGGFHLREVAWT